MSNQAILWSMLILPWLTLFFVRKEDIKRLMPVAIFASITSIIIVEAGTTLNLWVSRETVFPLSHISPYHLGLVPVVTLWLFKFTYKRFWQYVFLDVIYNIGFAYVFIPWFAARGIRENIGISSFNFFLIVTAHGLLLYIYQMWQEDALVPALGKLFSSKLQPVAGKALFKEDDENR